MRASRDRCARSRRGGAAWPRCRRRAWQAPRPCRGPGRSPRTGRRSRSAGRPAGGGESRAWPTAARSRSSGRCGLRLGTRSRWACPSGGERGGPSAWPRSFFELCHDPLVLSRMARAGADVAEAELVQDLAYRALVVDDAEALRDEVLQVDPAPAHDAMHGPIRAGLDEVGQFACCSAERRGGWPLDQVSFSPSGPRSLKR